MMNQALLSSAASVGADLRTGYVVELTESGNALVTLCQRPNQSEKLLCHFMLDASGHSISVLPGDSVLVAVPSDPQEIGCILGKVGAYNPRNLQSVQIEAANELSLKCGEASIKLRSDGKILSQGVDIASLAKRVQKIRGGSVQIN